MFFLPNICFFRHTEGVSWAIELHDDFVLEYNELPEGVQDELLAVIAVLEQTGPQLGRPAWTRLTAPATRI